MRTCLDRNGWVLWPIPELAQKKRSFSFSWDLHPTYLGHWPYNSRILGISCFCLRCWLYRIIFTFGSESASIEYVGTFPTFTFITGRIGIGLPFYIDSIILILGDHSAEIVVLMYFVLDDDDGFLIAGKSCMGLYVSAIHVESSYRKITMLYHIF